MTSLRLLLDEGLIELTSRLLADRNLKVLQLVRHTFNEGATMRLNSKFFKHSALIAAGLLTMGAQSQEAALKKGTDQEQPATEAPAPGTPKSAGETGIDKEITNARIRATSGSKSKLSLSSSLAYDGGSVKKPFGKTRPNISGDPEVEVDTAFGGSVAGRYRFNPNDSVTFGAGVSVLKPLHGAEDLSVDNPDVAYSRVYKLGAFQTVSSVGYTHGTSESYKDVDLNSVIYFSHNMMAQIGESRFTAGASFGLNFFNYGDDPVAGDPRTSYSVGIYPQLEYSFNDMLSARTVFGYFNFRNKRSDSNFDLERRYEYQSIGVGISVTRDFYLYPNVQFIPDNLDVDNTNVAISATINLF